MLKRVLTDANLHVQQLFVRQTVSGAAIGPAAASSPGQASTRGITYHQSRDFHETQYSIVVA